jgi:hypothetical protein
MSEEKSSLTIRVIPFSGKSVDWPIWSEKFLARAKRKGYKNILLGKTKVPRDAVDITKNEDGTRATSKEIEERKNLRKLNEEAYEDLILSVEGTTEAGRVVFQLIRSSKTANFSEGDASEAWSRLVQIRSNNRTLAPFIEDQDYELQDEVQARP